jgi:hypothetical protein
MKTTNKSLATWISICLSALFVFLFVTTENLLGQNSKRIDFGGCKNYNDSCMYLGNAYVEYLSEKKFTNLAELFSDDIFFRALIPSSLITSNDSEEVAKRINNWFYVDDSEKYEILNSKVEVLVDCLHIYYKRFETYKGTPYHVEQHLYCEVSDGKIEKLSLICSGFRKVMK